MFTLKCLNIVASSLFSICLIFAPALFISGGITYSLDRAAKNTHKLNTCKVMSSSYYETRCSGHRFTYVCFRPVWSVTYSVLQDDGLSESIIDATIEHIGGFRRAAAAEEKRNQYQVSASARDKQDKNSCTFRKTRFLLLFCVNMKGTGS